MSWFDGLENYSCIECGRHSSWLIDSIGTSVQKNEKNMPYPKRDIVKSPISFRFHGKVEAFGTFLLTESYITTVKLQIRLAGINIFLPFLWAKNGHI